MGAGCHYTNRTTKEIAYFCRIPESPHDDEDDFENQLNFDRFIEELGGIIYECGYVQNDDYGREFKNGLFIIELECKNDAVIIQINPRFDEDPSLYALAVANIPQSERKVIRAINKYYPVCYATSGYTANTIEKGDFK